MPKACSASVYRFFAFIVNVFDYPPARFAQDTSLPRDRRRMLARAESAAARDHDSRTTAGHRIRAANRDAASELDAIEMRRRRLVSAGCRLFPHRERVALHVQ